MDHAQESGPVPEIWAMSWLILLVNGSESTGNRKQLEEAEIIVINKVDVIFPERLAALRAALEREYPDARILEIASRDGLGVEVLFDIPILTRIQDQVNQVYFSRFFDHRVVKDGLEFGLKPALIVWLGHTG